MQVRRLDEEPAVDREVVSLAEQQLTIFVGPLLVQRSVTGVKHCARHQLVGGQKIRQQLPPRVVELLEQPHQEVAVELVNRLQIENVDVENARAGVGAIEADRAVRRALIEVLVRLPRDVESARGRTSLKGIDRIVKRRPATVEEVCADVQPSK